MRDYYYQLAPDCPNCGQKDSHEAWKGARMCSTAWGHGYSCCSDKCGYEFANSPKRWQLELRETDDEILSLQRHRESLRNKLKLARRGASTAEGGK